ncbi:hypothetical protein [Paractinoplanes maris]|uniref:hypothetical protein n=1 Tax=Paractinoplanes maris TaxID=1734446 RepID=UPI002021A8B8|nr:hypothetical protein [Actinoplanes maris]
MPFHPSSAVSVAFLVTAAAVIVAGYHLGRGRSSFWRGRPEIRRSPRATRPNAWIPTARIMTALLLLLIAMFAAAYSAGN